MKKLTFQDYYPNQELKVTSIVLRQLSHLASSTSSFLDATLMDSLLEESFAIKEFQKTEVIVTMQLEMSYQYSSVSYLEFSLLEWPPQTSNQSMKVEQLSPACLKSSDESQKSW